MGNANKIIETRQQKMEALRSAGYDLFPSAFDITHQIADIVQLTEKSPAALTDEAPPIALAGRIMAINKFGKSSFLRFKDRTGMLQAYLQKNEVGDETYTLFKQMDIGDFIGITGSMFQTKTGEWTLLAKTITLLCKTTRPLPEKFHGLKNPEKRYRQRYLDLLMNADTREIFIKRSRTIQSIRNFLLDRDFLEVETPMMQSIPGGAEARPFVTHHNALDMDLYLRIAPELYLKRLVIGGLERVFEINRNFRNEGVSTRHNPEFTMLEFYQAYADYAVLMETTEDLFQHVISDVIGDQVMTYQGNRLDFSRPWKRLSLLDTLRDIGGLADTLIHDKAKLSAFAESRQIKVKPTDTWGKIITKLFDVLVQPKLIQPTFITDYPVEVSPLSKTSCKQPDFVDRFELFIAGFEVANGFSELNDPEEQKNRFLDQVKARDAGDDEAHFMDEDYIEALEFGLPPTAGEGIGIDRLVMLLTDSPSIREVILFPHMRRE